MPIEWSQKLTKTDLLVIPCYAEKSPTNEQQIALEQYGHPDFEGKPNETLLLYPKSQWTPRILLVGLGKQEEETEESWRQAGGTVNQFLKKPLSTLTVLPPKEEVKNIRAFIEGLWLGHYQYEKFIGDKKRKLPPLPTIRCILQKKEKGEHLLKVLKETEKVVDAVKTTRDLANTPSNHMTPHHIAEAAQAIAKKSFYTKCKVFGENKLKKMGMGCLVGVGSGSNAETQLVILEYKHRPKNKKPIVLVGKGICFDSGGINLKNQWLEDMKFDMSGAATVLGVMKILAELKPALHVIGIAPCAENILANEPTKPGDVHTAYDGTTVEITNTDAEGRLVLADAIGYAVKEYKPELLIDIATLTGAVSTALGKEITAFFSNTPAHATKLKVAAQCMAEKIWELPLEKEYKKYLCSPVADLCNYNSKAMGWTILGALFLEHFVKETPWLHLDMGLNAWNREEKPYTPMGGAGNMVRTLWEFLKNY